MCNIQPCVWTKRLSIICFKNMLGDSVCIRYFLNSLSPCYIIFVYFLVVKQDAEKKTSQNIYKSMTDCREQKANNKTSSLSVLSSYIPGSCGCVYGVVYQTRGVSDFSAPWDPPIPAWLPPLQQLTLTPHSQPLTSHANEQHIIKLFSVCVCACICLMMQPRLNCRKIAHPEPPTHWYSFILYCFPQGLTRLALS